MLRNYHPVLRDLALRHFSRGDALSDLVQHYPTIGATKYGHFSIFGRDGIYWESPSNHTSVEEIARDGKLIFAEAWGSVKDVPWDFIFFHTTNDAEMLRQVDRETVQDEKQRSGRKIPDSSKTTTPNTALEPL